MTCVDHQEAMQNMADISVKALTEGSRGGAVSPSGPYQERDHSRMVEHKSGQHQAKAGVCRGLITPLIGPQMVSNRSSGEWGCHLAPRH